jgi:hypothetical protein
MTLSARARYLLLTAAIVTAAAIQLLRGYKPLIVIVGTIAFLFAGNLMVYLTGSRERAIRLQKKRDYYAGRS